MTGTLAGALTALGLLIVVTLGAVLYLIHQFCTTTVRYLRLIRHDLDDLLVWLRDGKDGER